LVADQIMSTTQSINSVAPSTMLLLEDECSFQLRR
jgi:hypothetical protein